MESPQDGRTGMHVSIAEGKKGRRKVGRPITYQGSPSSPDLTPEERRVILRRIANRESARRVRGRRQEELERLTQKADHLERSNAILCHKFKKAQAYEAHLHEDSTQLNKDILAKEQENAELCKSIVHLREREAIPYPLHSSFKGTLPILSGPNACTEVPIQPDTPIPTKGDPFARDGQWLACLNEFADNPDFALNPSSFFNY